MSAAFSDLLIALYAIALGLWLLASTLRMAKLYDLHSPWQRWRRFDHFSLVPVGAFFSPNPPPTEFTLLVRDIMPDGSVTPWTEVPTITARSWRDIVWSPKKHLYRARLDVARALCEAAGGPSGTGPYEATPSLMLTDAYLALLRFAIELPRAARPRAVQFAAVELALPGRLMVRNVLSAVHEL